MLMNRQKSIRFYDNSVTALACLFAAGYFVVSFFTVLVTKNQVLVSSQIHTLVLYFFTSWFLVMTAIYTALALVLQKSSILSLKKIFLWLSVFVIILLPLLPATSGDLYHYILQGKVLSHYGENPFTFSAGELKHDVFHLFVYPVNIGYPTVYGPVFVLLSSVLTFLFGNFFIVSLYAFKAIFILLHLANVFLIYRIIQKIQPKLSGMAAVLYAWNPFIIFETAQNGHNDSVMIFFILLSVHLYVQKKYIWVMPALLLAAMSKYIALMLLPLFGVFLLRNKDRIKPAIYARSFVVGCLLVVFTYAPFWQGVKTFEGFLSITKISHANTIMSAVVSFFTKAHPDIFRNYLLIAFLSVYALLLVRTYQRPQLPELMKASLWAFFWYLAIASTWLMTWYFLWPLPFAFLSGKRHYFLLGVIISVGGLLANVLPFLLLFVILALCVFVLFCRHTMRSRSSEKIL